MPICSSRQPRSQSRRITVPCDQRRPSSSSARSAWASMCTIVTSAGSATRPVDRPIGQRVLATQCDEEPLAEAGDFAGRRLQVVAPGGRQAVWGRRRRPEAYATAAAQRNRRTSPRRTTRSAGSRQRSPQGRCACRYHRRRSFPAAKARSMPRPHRDREKECPGIGCDLKPLDVLDAIAPQNCCQIGLGRIIRELRCREKRPAADRPAPTAYTMPPGPKSAAPLPSR